MEKQILFEIPGLYRDDFKVTGFYFGNKQYKDACIVGSTRGNENQQLYVCSKLIQALKELEEKGMIHKEKGILVIPTINTYSLNTKKRFWGIDNTDINRMFPGYDEGETTQRIASAVFEKINDYTFGMQLASFYMPGNFMPHVRVMSISDQQSETSLELAKQFDFPYVLAHDPRPFDTSTLNYNWQIWGTKAFSIYTTTTERVDKESAKKAVNAIIRFLCTQGIIMCDVKSDSTSKRIKSSDITTIRAKSAGFYDSFVEVGEVIHKGQILAEISDSYEGDKVSQIISDVDGTILFARNESKMYANTAVYKVVTDK